MTLSVQDSQTIAEEQSTYFELMAEIGHTKHIGGLKATGRLLEMIAPQPGDHVLDVGRGVGIAAVFLAGKVGCQVTGVDITPRMLERAQERARRSEVSDRIKFRVANMHRLPYADNTFNSAFAESVLTFSQDKGHVLNELLRVVKPGGVVAFPEAIFVQPPPPGKADFMARAGGMPEGLLNNEAWRELLLAGDLQDIVAEAHAVSAREESQNQYGRVGPADYLRAFPGFFKVLANSRYRQVFRTGFASMPREYFKYIGYGIYGGRKGNS